MENNSGRILLVDDEESFRLPIGVFLRHSGFQCDCANDAIAAVPLLKANDYDLLLSDIQMPGNAGLALIQEIPQIQAGLPVILITGSPTVETAVQAMQLSVFGYLIKPVDLGKLLDLARKAIQECLTYRALCGSRNQVQQWLQDLRRMEEVTRPGSNATGGDAMGLYPPLMMGNMVQMLHHLSRYFSVLSRQKEQIAWLNADEQTSIVAAMQEAVSVLEKSKNFYKCKEFGDLRKKLAALMDSIPPHPLK
jgi:FixJ family two-component response regulator